MFYNKVTSARKANAVKPVFDENNEIRLSNITEDFVAIGFDQASIPENTVGDIVHSYKYDFTDTKTGTVVKTFKTWSEYYFTPMPETITQVASDLSGGTEYELRIYAIDAYGLVSDERPFNCKNLQRGIECKTDSNACKP